MITLVRKVNEGIKDQSVLEEASSTIDSVKWDLMRFVSKLEEAGYVRKAKTLDRIVRELERWQHTR